MRPYGGGVKSVSFLSFSYFHLLDGKYLILLLSRQVIENESC